MEASHRRMPHPRSSSLRSQKQRFSTLIHHSTYSEGNHPTPLIIVIDALDECDDYAGLRAVLRAMTDVLAQQSSPIRLLLTSRPEPPIVSFFRGIPPLTYEEIELKADEEANDDILRYLRHEFSRIRTIHSEILLGMGEWPLPGDISWIADKASGHFMYAATVIRFIDDDWENPADALDYIRGRLRSCNHSRRPLDAFDELYLAILRRAEARGNLSNLLRLLAVYSSRNSTLLELHSEHDAMARASNLKRERVTLLHRNFRSLISPIGNPFRTNVTGFLHGSLYDFLLDSERAQEFFVGGPEYVLFFRHLMWYVSSFSCLLAINNHFQERHELSSRQNRRGG